MKTFKIYCLTYQGEIIYVGRTSESKLETRKMKGYKHIPYYRDCEIHLLEETDDINKENYWIDYYREQGCDLLNMRRGDVLIGADKRTRNLDYYEKNKEKILQYHKDYRKTEKHKEYNKIYRHTEKYKTYQKEYQKQYREKNKEVLEEKALAKYSSEDFKKKRKEYYHTKPAIKKAIKKHHSTVEFKKKWNEYMKAYLKKKRDDKKSLKDKTND